MRRLAVVGAGIVGLAHALVGARRGDQVTVFERDCQPQGASIRNFGLGMLFGQAPGEMLELARLSRTRWLELLPAINQWHKAAGSLMVALDAEQWDVLRCFHQHGASQYPTELVTRGELQARQLHGLGALHSAAEIGFESRKVLPALVQYLQTKHGVRFVFSALVQRVEMPHLETSRGRFLADQVIVCSGHDFQTLFPEQLAPLGLDQCALQMLRLADPGLRIGPTLLTGLSALHYPSFRSLPELEQPLAALRTKVQVESPAVLEDGIHLIVQQIESGELIVGDSHHYGAPPAPFHSESIDTHLLCLARSVLGRPMLVQQRWQGIYAHGPRPYEVVPIADDVTVVIVTSGIGMSIAFALAERVLTHKNISPP